jgi:hypothetical protein
LEPPWSKWFHQDIKGEVEVMLWGGGKESRHVQAKSSNKFLGSEKSYVEVKVRPTVQGKFVSA